MPAGDVVLVEDAVLERERSRLEQSPLAAEPIETVVTERAFVFAYDDVVYGLVTCGGSSDVVFEDLRDVSVGRAFDVAARPLDPEPLRALVARLGR
jgi:hypothetical protein